MQLQAKVKRFSGLIKYAAFDAHEGRTPAAYQDTTKLWVQLEYVVRSGGFDKSRAPVQEVEDSGAALNVSRIGDELQARARTRQLHLEHGADAGFGRW